MCVRAATFPALPPRVHSYGAHADPSHLRNGCCNTRPAGNPRPTEPTESGATRGSSCFQRSNFKFCKRGERERERQTIRPPASLLDPDTRTFPLPFFFLFILKFFYPLRERRGTANNPQIKYTRSISFFLCKTRGDVLLTAPV